MGYCILQRQWSKYCNFLETFTSSPCGNSSQKHADVAKDRLPTATCYCCDGKHNHSTCPFKSEVCRYCKKRGHIAKVRMNKTPVTVDYPPSNTRPR